MCGFALNVQAVRTVEYAGEGVSQSELAAALPDEMVDVIDALRFAVGEMLFAAMSKGIVLRGTMTVAGQTLAIGEVADG